MAKSAKQKSSPSAKRAPDPTQAQTPYDFWEEQADAHAGSDLATNPDQHYRKLEINSLLRVLGMMEHDTILDVGCGNGYTTMKMADKFPGAMVIGVDFSPKMIQQAKFHTGKLEFYEGDVLSLSRDKFLEKEYFDVVVSTRCLINLANWQEQKVGILEMRKMLKPDGRLILIENFKEGLANLNQIRNIVGLLPIKERWHNNYIPDGDFRRFLANSKQIVAQEYAENIGNFYYLASRVIYAKQCQDAGIEPDYNNSINEIAANLPTLGEFYACSPNNLIVLRKISGNQSTPDRSLS